MTSSTLTPGQLRHLFKIRQSAWANWFKDRDNPDRQSLDSYERRELCAVADHLEAAEQKPVGITCAVAWTKSAACQWPKCGCEESAKREAAQRAAASPTPAPDEQQGIWITIKRWNWEAPGDPAAILAFILLGELAPGYRLVKIEQEEEALPNALRSLGADPALDTGTRAICNDAADLLDARAGEIKRLRDALSKMNEEISQTLGRALDYPKFSDDQKNFPDATGDEVCVGDHVAESLASEAASKINAQKGEIEKTAKVIADQSALCAQLTRDLDQARRDNEHKNERLRQFAGIALRAEASEAREVGLREALDRLVADVLDYEHTSKLAPNPGHKYCWDSTAKAVTALSQSSPVPEAIQKVLEAAMAWAHAPITEHDAAADASDKLAFAVDALSRARGASQ